ncbi:MAG: SelL-related redox protein [Planctomycetota bacterium]
MSVDTPAPRWTVRVLLLAAIVDVVGGVLLAFAPTAPFAWAGLEVPRYPAVLQGLGIAIAAFGLGLALAARHPYRHWPLVVAALVAKVLLPVVFAVAASGGQLPWALGLAVLAYGPIWWVPFGLILRSASKAHRVDQTPPVLPLDLALSLYKDEDGTDLLQASKEQPQFLVFLRHFGCTFCRQALADLGTINDQLRAAGTRLVLVHMSTEDEACSMFGQYGLSEVTGISDPDRVLYRAFALRRGTPAQLLGWSIWKRGWEAGVKQGHGIGWLRGDAAQMPGAFVVSQGQVVAQFIHETAADRPDYVDVAAEGVDSAVFQENLEHDGLGVGFQERLRELLTSDAGGRN